MTNSFRAAAVVAAVAGLLAVVPLRAQGAPPTAAPTRVTFKAGTSGTTLSGDVTGEELRTWVLSARRGQTVRVALKSARASWLVLRLYPEQTPAGADVLSNFITSDLTMTGTLPADGEYIVQLGLRRADARRGGQAPFEIELSIK